MVLPLGDLAQTRIVPLATYGLIALNVVLYLIQVDHGPAFTTAYAATPYEITHDEDIPQPFILPLPGDENPLGLPGRVELKRRIIDQAPVPFPVWLTMVTAIFLHGSPLHLAGNMLYLWIFGDNVEEVLGTVRYLIVYLGCGLMGTLLQIAANPDSLIPTLGASGAIAGLMGAYVVWFPHNQVRVLVFRFITQMPAYLVIGGWILLQIWEGVGSVGQLGEVGGVAYLAHIGGAATGIGVALLFSERGPPVPGAGPGERRVVRRPLTAFPMCEVLRGGIFSTTRHRARNPTKIEMPHVVDRPTLANLSAQVLSWKQLAASSKNLGILAVCRAVEFFTWHPALQGGNSIRVGGPLQSISFGCNAIGAKFPEQDPSMDGASGPS